MKLAIVFGSLLFSISGCKSDEQVEADRVSGGWRISKIDYFQKGNSTPDSSVNYSKSSFEFGTCKLTASNRECFGYYSINGLDRSAVMYSIAPQGDRMSLSLVDQNNKKGIDLTGSFQIQENNPNTLVLYGPAGYIDKNGQFHSQALDVRLTLNR
ncbi:hypothetical protein GCM10028817_03910 [Spirosoma pomorum]